MDSSPRIGFVGVGTIGRPLVESMLQHGLTPVVFDVDAGAVERVAAKGAVPATNLAELAQGSDVIGICVPADSHVLDVMCAPDGLLAHLSPGSVVAIHSTVSADTIDEVSAAAEKVGVRLVEACLTGGPRAAAAGATTFLLGGEPADIDALEPLLSACGEVRVHAGPLGAASRLKLCLNLSTYASQAGVAEAIALAGTLDVPTDGLKAAMQANGQLSDLTEPFFTLHEMPLEVIEEPSLLKFRTAQQRIVAKDMALMVDVGAEHGIDIPVLEAARSAFERTYRLPRPD